MGCKFTNYVLTSDILLHDISLNKFSITDIACSRVTFPWIIETIFNSSKNIEPNSKRSLIVNDGTTLKRSKLVL